MPLIPREAHQLLRLPGHPLVPVSPRPGRSAYRSETTSFPNRFMASVRQGQQERDGRGPARLRSTSLSVTAHGWLPPDPTDPAPIGAAVSCARRWAGDVGVSHGPHGGQQCLQFFGGQRFGGSVEVCENVLLSRRLRRFNLASRTALSQPTLCRRWPQAGVTQQPPVLGTPQGSTDSYPRAVARSVRHGWHQVKDRRTLGHAGVQSHPAVAQPFMADDRNRVSQFFRGGSGGAGVHLTTRPGRPGADDRMAGGAEPRCLPTSAAAGRFGMERSPTPGSGVSQPNHDLGSVSLRIAQGLLECLDWKQGSRGSVVSRRKCPH
jgi:hypothetical protein